MAALEAERLIAEEEAEDDAIPADQVHVPAEHYMGADKE
jgi:thioredoxin reductase (NADPH)